ncbi:hypothetical protein [Lactococcus sp.]|uniref:hypothetical protein n=1 Tax=Lactococcus sp. TaxID=44273 RepID=UPI0035B21598
MEVEKIIEAHEEKLKQHDKEIQRLDDRTVLLQNAMNATFTQIEESNKFLREQNTAQVQQNEKILNAVLERNDIKDTRAYELKKVGQENLWKMIFGIGSASALIWGAIQWLIKTL